MNIATARKIPMVDLLIHLGHHKVFTRKGGKEYWYHSPFRRERTPSFKVNTGLNCWADFGIGGLYHKPDKIGGNIIDFVKHEKQTSSTSEALRYLRELNIFGNGDRVKIHRSMVHDFGKEMKENVMELEEVKPLESKLLGNYLESREIDLEIAKQYLQECHYRVRGKGWGGTKGHFLRWGCRMTVRATRYGVNILRGCWVRKKM